MRVADLRVRVPALASCAPAAGPLKERLLTALSASFYITPQERQAAALQFLEDKVSWQPMKLEDKVRAGRV